MAYILLYISKLCKTIIYSGLTSIMWVLHIISKVDLHYQLVLRYICE